jgi:cyclase
MQGYDLDLIRRVAESVTIPVVACGGAGNLHHLAEAIQAGASAAAAGSMFVFQGPLRGVLISYPAQEELRKVIAQFG